MKNSNFVEESTKIEMKGLGKMNDKLFLNYRKNA